MSPEELIAQLAANAAVFRSLLANVPAGLVKWKPAPEHWCLLEIACHLHDEEGEDFRARLESVLRDPIQPLPRTDPMGWVTERDYLSQDFGDAVAKFLEERTESIQRFASYKTEFAPNGIPWDNAFQHPTHCPLTATMFLENWLAHDYLHIRQINRRKYEYLREHCATELRYAGEW